MNGVHPQNVQAKAVRPPPTGPTPPAPITAPPVPPGARTSPPHNHGHSPNGHAAQKGKKTDLPIDPVTMYESLKSRIAALEEEEILEEEEERRYAEEAQNSVRGMEEKVIHAKYIELFAELKRLEREHAKEKQKLVKDKDAAKSQLTKANQTKTKMENLARELQKDNKRLREDGRRLAQSVEEAQDELSQMKNDLAKRAEKAKMQDLKYREMPDIVIKVVCRYRAELFFKISRKTKLSRLFMAWTERMERPLGKKGNVNVEMDGAEAKGDGNKGEIAASGATPMQFVFTHNGRNVDAEQTPEEAGIDDGDEILAIEMMDLTDPTGAEPWEEYVGPQREKLARNWIDEPSEARRSIEEIFDGVVRERLKEVLRQYELRERHFECVIRSKELEVLLSRARAAEQKQLAETEKTRADKQEEENSQLKRDLKEAHEGQTLLIDKLIACCKEIIQKPNAERTQRLFASLREELERKSPRAVKKLQADGPTGGWFS